MYIYFFFFLPNRFCFIPLPKKRFAWNLRKKKKKIGCAIIAITIVKIRGENRDEQRSRSGARGVLTPIQTIRWKFLSRSRGRLSTFRLDPHASAAAISSRPTSVATIRARACFLSSSMDCAASASDTLRSPSSSTRACRFRTLPKGIARKEFD